MNAPQDRSRAWPPRSHLWDNQRREGSPRKNARAVMARPRNDEMLSRRTFLKLGLAGLSATALLFLSGCLGEEQEEEEGEEED